VTSTAEFSQSQTELQVRLGTDYFRFAVSQDAPLRLVGPKRDAGKRNNYEIWNGARKRDPAFFLLESIVIE
jgi:hypothetical protein